MLRAINHVSNPLANIDSLIGRYFTASSSNVARLSKLDDGALKMHWLDYPPSARDIEEAEAWVLGFLGGEYEVTRYSGNCKADEAKALADWRKRNA